MLLLLTAFHCASFAQKTDTLKEVKVRGRHKLSHDDRLNDFSPGQKITSIDSVTLQQYQLQNIGTVLSQQVPVFVKAYGFNSLATLNFRGSSAAQSQILWNGIPIQNAALGIADVSTLPVFLMNKVNIVYGGSAAMWGSGNVGGALLLENEAPLFDSSKHSYAISLGSGSYGQYIGGAKGMIAAKRWYFSGSVQLQSATNDFAFTDNTGHEIKMPNSHLQSEAILLNGAYKTGNLSALNVWAWWQQYDREIPPALFENGSAKKQTDGSMRLLAQWERKTGSNSIYARASLIRDDVKYSDTAVLLNTANIVNQSFNEIGWKKQTTDNSRLLLFAPVQVAWMATAHGDKQQIKAALAGAYDIQLADNKLDIAINARDEAINNTTVFLPGANASYVLTSWLSLRTNVQRTYRAPSLNELYYIPGGNSDLKPEQGWNEDAGYKLKLQVGRTTLTHDLSVFNRNIHDWIIWLGGAIWTPHNIAEVHSRGIETENNISYRIGRWQVHLGINTAYMLATTVNSYITNDGSVDKQIPYAPRYNGQANLGFSFKGISINYNHTYTGYRFITSDESAWLQPYQTGNVQLMYTTPIRGHSIQLTAQCNNIWNQHYQVVAFRPMPGINWLAGLRFGLGE